jgi:ATP-binding cassette subfamily B protein/subfamily B ATP-binding cassette protein MsbA
MKDWLRALRYFRAETPRVAGALGLMAAATALNALKPWPLALIVDCVLGSKPLPHWLGARAWDRRALLAGLAASILLLYILQGALAAARDFCAIRAGLNGLRRLREELFQWLQRQSLRQHQGARSGDVLSRASWDTYSIQTLFQQGLMAGLGALLSLAVMIAVMARINLYLTLLALALSPLLLLAIKSFGPRMRQRTTLAQQADSRVTSLIGQGLATVALTQSYGREELVAEKFSVQAGVASEARLAQHGWELAYGLAVGVVFALGTAGLTWLGAAQVIAGRLTVGELLVFLAYLAQVFEPLHQLSHVGATVAGASAGARRVFEILDTMPDLPEKADARALGPPGPVGILFDKVTFGRGPGRKVLQGVSWQLRPGEHAALVGPSGSGKTTLLQLCVRFLDPEEGTIRMDGMDLRELRLREVRARVTYLQQEPVLLAGTIAENIGFGRAGATQAGIEAAARLANADGFIGRLPAQYETVVGDGAARLSAGECQRIHLARAFLKDAPIILLDEPTSALDAESEALVARSLEELLRGRTALIATHRPATIAKLPRAFALSDGRLTECSVAEAVRRMAGV